MTLFYRTAGRHLSGDVTGRDHVGDVGVGRMWNLTFEESNLNLGNYLSTGSTGESL
jgi:hypothetical protein